MFQFEIDRLMRVLHMRMQKYYREMDEIPGFVYVRSWRQLKFGDISVYDIDIEHITENRWAKEDIYRLNPYLSLSMTNVVTILQQLKSIYYASEQEPVMAISMLYSALFKKEISKYDSPEFSFQQCTDRILCDTDKGWYSMWDTFTWKHSSDADKSLFLTALLACNYEVNGSTDPFTLDGFSDRWKRLCSQYNTTMLLAQKEGKKLYPIR